MTATIFILNLSEIFQQFIIGIEQTSLLEFIAVVFGIASVIFWRLENVLGYPVGLVNTAIYIYLYVINGLYADASVNFYYTVMSIIGWRMWVGKRGGFPPLSITKSTRTDWITTILFFSVCSTLLYLALKNFTDSTVPQADAFTSAAAFTAMWLMNKKKIENWFWWIIVNLASIPLNFYKNLVFTSLQYLVFLILAFMGYVAWRKNSIMQLLNKIVIIGPESTGKSTLCEQLAQHYKTLWVPEFARKHMEQHGTHYTYEDLLTIAKKQVALEEEYQELSAQYLALNTQHSTLNIQHSTFKAQYLPLTNDHSLLIIDTDMYVMKVWCEFVFNKCHNWILTQIAGRIYDLYLLCDVDLPWTKDNLREYPDLETRNKLYHYYKDSMINQSTPGLILREIMNKDLKKQLKQLIF